MPDSLIDLASRLFVGPVWPASILAILLVIYALLSLLGIFDLGLNAPDFDPTPSLGAELTRLIPLNWDFMQGIGGSTIRWTNFGRLPIILWGSVFAVAFWMFSYGLWHQYDSIKYMDDWMSRYQSWKNFIMVSYDNRMMELIKTIDIIAFKKMDERLLDYLEKKAVALNSNSISVTHQEIAYDLNASREAVSRLLKQLERDGLVKLGRNRIELVD